MIAAEGLAGSRRVGSSVLRVFFGLLLSFSCLADISVDTQSLRLQFSAQGDLLHAHVCFPLCDATNVKIRRLSSEQGMLAFERGGSAQIAATRRDDESGTVLTFLDNENRIQHRWRIPDKGWVIEVDSLGADSAVMQSGEDFRPPPASGFGYLLEQSRYLIFDGSSVENIGFDDTEQTTRPSTGWFGFRSRFWTAMLLPDAQLDLQLVVGEKVQDARIEMQLDPLVEHHLKLYLGPVEPGALSQAAPELEKLMYSGLWFWLRWICQALYFMLNGIAMYLPQWGLAVMVLSVLVGLLMRPLSNIADRLQAQVQQVDTRLAPLLAEIKKDYKGAEQSEKILTMYKEEGVHPLYSLKSLAGVMVVIPIFIGAFDMLAENIHLVGESFLWITDLSSPDQFLRLPFDLPFFGAYMNLLPFIMTGFSFVASKLHRHPSMDEALQRKQARNLVFMSIGFLILFYTFPAGMVLYWATNNLISIFRTWWKQRKIPGTS